VSPIDIGKATAKETRAVLVRLADVAAEPVEWVWTNRIALGKLTLIVGDVGAGKTYFTTDVTARVTRGAAWPDGAPSGDPSHVILLTSEDGIADTIRPRVDWQGGDPDRVDILRAVTLDTGGEAAFNLERDLPALEGAILATKARVVVADPLSAYLGKKDSYKDAEIRGLLTPLADVAERRRVAMLGLLHLTKAQQRRILHRVQASIAFVAQARTVLAVGEDPDTGRRLVAPLKNNLGPLPSVLAFRIGDKGLRWEPGIVEGTAETLLAGDEAPTRSERQELDRAMLFLTDELCDGPVRSTEVVKDAKANGISERTLWRAKAVLGVPAHRHGQGPWYWMRPRPETSS
jgi:putative DNA primase/helicase